MSNSALKSGCTSIIHGNAYVPIYVTEFGIITLVIPVLSNAFLPIYVTELGIVIEVRLEQPLKV